MKWDEDGKRDRELLKSKNKIGKAFLAFSFSRNLRKMFWTPQKDDDYLTVFNGIRVISMFYIIFGHVHELYGGMPVVNPDAAGNILTSLYGNIVMGAFYSVDVFFFMSAFLGTYLLIPKLKRNNIITLLLIYFHRFFRIIPTLGMFLWLFISFYVFLGNGPLWHLTDFGFVEP